MKGQKVHPLEEDWDVIALSGRILISRRGTATRDGVLQTVGYLARRLRTNTLRDHDRAYLADLLDKIAKEQKFLPKKPSRPRGPSDLEIWAAFERDCQMRDKAGLVDRAASYGKVARFFDMDRGTATKRCSHARRQLREWVARGGDKLIEAFAKEYKLPVAVVEKIAKAKTRTSQSRS